MTSVSPDSYSTAEAPAGRSAPWSAEAEQAVLGAMLLEQDAALRAVELIDERCFTARSTAGCSGRFARSPSGAW